MPQATVNIGTIGHVDHGKTTLVSAITGKWTDTHSEEQKRGITIQLGFADVTFYKCAKCPEPFNYSSTAKCPHCGGEATAERRISFIDSPGHETLMATVIAASSIMDGALFVIAANEKCPQPQTIEHLAVLEAAGIRKVVVAQTKIDLIEKAKAAENYESIRAFLQGSAYEDAPIIPTSINSPKAISALISALQEHIPTPQRKTGEPLRMLVARSFDVNKPGSAIAKIVGGVVGGSIVFGEIAVGDEIEIAPGLLKKKKDREEYERLKTKVTALHADKDKLQSAGPGGLIAVATALDPALTRANALVGNTVGKAGTLAPNRTEIDVEITALKRTVEVFSAAPGINEPLVLGIGTNTTVGFVTERKKKNYMLKLKKPVCANAGETLAVMRRANNRWHLYGTAKIL
ncbi:MAG: translation initiation factor IF-2 subunit gamma [Candidatus Micrarchaeota archaeon]